MGGRGSGRRAQTPAQKAEKTNKQMKKAKEDDQLSRRFRTMLGMPHASCLVPHLPHLPHLPTCDVRPDKSAATAHVHVAAAARCRISTCRQAALPVHDWCDRVGGEAAVASRPSRGRAPGYHLEAAALTFTAGCHVIATSASYTLLCVVHYVLTGTVVTWLPERLMAVAPR